VSHRRPELARGTAAAGADGLIFTFPDRARDFPPRSARLPFLLTIRSLNCAVCASSGDALAASVDCRNFPATGYRVCVTCASSSDATRSPVEWGCGRQSRRGVSGIDKGRG
jgi:hypothetical protein